MEAMTSSTPDANSGESVVRTRRAPKYGVFVALGAAVGLLAAVILSTVFDGTAEASEYTEIDYSTSQVFGFIVLWCVPAGVAVAMVVALILDRTVGRKVHEHRAVREVTEEPEED